MSEENTHISYIVDNVIDKCLQRTINNVCFIHYLPCYHF